MSVTSQTAWLEGQRLGFSSSDGGRDYDTKILKWA